MVIPAGFASTRQAAARCRTAVDLRQGGTAVALRHDEAAIDLRQAGPAVLESALTAQRAELLALFDGFEAALGGAGLRIAFDPVLNLPLWELGHIGWFEEYWLARNAEQRGRGAACDPAAPRTASLRLDADGLYDSSRVAHARRWQLDLPSPAATRAYLADVRVSTLALLHAGAASDDDLYFFRLCLFHESMHAEAWHFMAQQLGIDLGGAMRGRSPATSGVSGEWSIPTGVRSFGSPASGFAFDNELAAGERRVGAFTIDRAPLTWARFLPFIEAGGYRQPAFWTVDGWAWRTGLGREQPRHLRRGAGSQWEQRRFGHWHPLDLEAPVCQVSAHEARAWCRSAGRRLPTEAEWETAARLAAVTAEAFAWGQVWEWTASPFAPYPGFAAHPYRDYSAPCFDGRPVLRGGSFATSTALCDPRLRNFFAPDRDDVFAGFRSCADSGTD